MSDSKGLVKLNADANNAIISMIVEIKGLDGDVSINKSKLTSMIVLDYLNSKFEIDKKNLIMRLKNQRKILKTKISELNEDELINMMKYLEKVKNSGKKSKEVKHSMSKEVVDIV